MQETSKGRFPDLRNIQLSLKKVSKKKALPISRNKMVGDLSSGGKKEKKKPLYNRAAAHLNQTWTFYGTWATSSPLTVSVQPA